ncbi:MAG: carboxynorspermidine decarboxylase [Chitinophagales bacterium]|nr:carboxynorspermidine decarboxylase [Chitinophagales bacterium]
MSVNLKKVPSPCFVLEEDLLKRNLELMKYVQQEAGVQIIVALKGFAFHKAFPLLGKYLAGGTASSLHEAKLVYQKLKTRPHTYCAAYVPSEFEELVDISSHLTFNSLSQWAFWKKRALKASKKVSFGLRVNPGYSEIATALYDPASESSRLGISRKLLGDVLPKGIDGLHFHALCENDSYTLERVLQSFTERYDNLLKTCKWVNMGGGHLMTKKGYDVEHLISVLKQFKEKYPNLEEVILEPGSAVGWETGFLKSTVLDIVDNGSGSTAMLDVSFTCHMPDCLEMPYKPKVRGEVDNGQYVYNMGGLSCLAGDFMEGFKFDKPLHVGDTIIFEDMIHYTMVKTSTFNGINLPSIGTWTSDNKFKLHKTFGYKDYKNRLS